MIGPLQREVLEALADGEGTVRRLIERNGLPESSATTEACEALYKAGFIGFDVDGGWNRRYSLTDKGRAELGLPEADAPTLNMGGTQND